MAIRLPGTWLTFGAIAALLVPAAALGAEFQAAFVDQQRAILGSTEGRAAEKAFNELATQKQAEIAPREEELRRLSSELEAQRYVLTPQAIEERRLELVKKSRDLERTKQEVTEQLQLEQRKTMAPLIKKLNEAVSAIGKEKKLSLILDRSSPGVLYLEDALDITELVIKRLNQ